MIERKRQKKKIHILPLKSLPINSQVHDLARIHLVVSDRSSSWTSWSKKQWPPRTPTKKWFIEWSWNILLNFSRNWTKHLSFFTGQKRSLPIIQISFVRPSDTTQYVLLGQKDPEKWADVSTSVQVTYSKAIKPPWTAETLGTWDCAHSRG